MIENADDTKATKNVVYFVPGELVLLATHPANAMGSDRRAFEENLVSEVSQHFNNNTGATGQRVREALQNPNRRRIASLKTSAASLTTMALATELSYDDLILNVEELNNRFRETRSDGTFALRRASLNWLTSPAQGSTHTVGGPGAKPVEVDEITANKKLENELESILKLLNSLQSEYPAIANPVINIAILDTVPPLPLLASQLHQLILNSPTPHPLEKLIGTSPTFNTQLNADGNFLVVSGNNLPNPHLSFRISYNLTRHHDSRLLMDVLSSGDESVDLLDHPYKMTDHGLFIAGTIASFLDRVISELNLNLQVNIHLIQVLNDYGVGTVDSLVGGLNWAVNYPDFTKGNPMVINCSLTLTTPREGHFIDLKGMANETHGILSPHSCDYLYSFASEGSSQAEDLLSPIGEVVEQLASEDITIAAAAGNESKGLTQRRKARFPAAFKEIMGVAALDENGQMASYSNERDRPISAGADALGGESEIINDEEFSTYGVPGWYIGAIPKSTQNPYPKPSQSGWALWSGTSFATPRIALRMALLRAFGLSKQQIQGVLDNDPVTN